jgi:hypothetical protein
MAVLSLVGIDAKQWEPLAILALAGVAGYFLWQHLQATTGNAALNAAGASTTQAIDNEEQLAVLSALTGGGAGTSSPSQLANPDQVFYTAPQTSGGTATATASTSSTGQGGGGGTT